jgi:hypothetical protein
VLRDRVKVEEIGKSEMDEQRIMKAIAGGEGA